MKRQIALGMCTQGGTDLPPHWAHSTKTYVEVCTSQAPCLLFCCNADSLWDSVAMPEGPWACSPTASSHHSNIWLCAGSFILLRHSVWCRRLLGLDSTLKNLSYCSNTALPKTVLPPPKIPAKAQKGTYIKLSPLSSSPTSPTQISSLATQLFQQKNQCWTRLRLWAKGWKTSLGSEQSLWILLITHQWDWMSSYKAVQKKECKWILSPDCLYFLFDHLYYGWKCRSPGGVVIPTGFHAPNQSGKVWKAEITRNTS